MGALKVLDWHGLRVALWAEHLLDRFTRPCVRPTVSHNIFAMNITTHWYWTLWAVACNDNYRADVRRRSRLSSAPIVWMVFPKAYPRLSIV